MEFVATGVLDVYLVRAHRHEDDRGWFGRVYCAEEFATHGLVSSVAQVNLAMTAQAGTVRGLHYQLPPGAEAKLVRCVEGSIFDVVVDVRAGSPTLGQWFGTELRSQDPAALYVPPGCAHGYQALTDGARALYQVSTPYNPNLERGLHHADPDVGIDWPLPPANVSPKDHALPPIGQTELV